MEIKTKADFLSMENAKYRNGLRPSPWYNLIGEQKAKQIA
jgi:hypothetical protein